MWAVVYAGLCIGDVLFSHVLPAGLVPGRPNPGLMTAGIILLPGGLMALLNASYWPWLLPGMAFFALTPLAILGSGVVGRRWRVIRGRRKERP